MITIAPIVLEGHGVRLEPLEPAHHDSLAAAAADGELWNLWYTSVPTADQVANYITTALDGLAAGHMLPWVVRDVASNRIVGTSRYHDIIAECDRVEIGWTWYGASAQHTHINPACKLLLMQHAFETLGCQVVGLRTDNFNFRSQRAIEALGAHKDGVLRHHFRRRDGSVRDSVCYSILRHEWPAVRRNLEWRLNRQ